MVAVNYLWNPINDNIVREFDDTGNTIAEYTTEPDTKWPPAGGSPFFLGAWVSAYSCGKELKGCLPCKGTGAWPKELSTIVPAAIGTLWREWTYEAYWISPSNPPVADEGLPLVPPSIPISL